MVNNESRLVLIMEKSNQPHPEYYSVRDINNGDALNEAKITPTLAPPTII